MRDLRALIANDSHAATFQSLGQYRTALLREIDAAAPEGAQGVIVAGESELDYRRRQMKAVWSYLSPNESNDMEWADEIIIAIQNRAPAVEADEAMATRFFDAGWYACADLAGRDDLPHDVGSPFYDKKLAAALGREVDRE